MSSIDRIMVMAGEAMRNADMQIHVHSSNLLNQDLLDHYGNPVTTTKVLFRKGLFGWKQERFDSREEIEPYAEAINLKRAREKRKLATSIMEEVVERSKQEERLLEV